MEFIDLLDELIAKSGKNKNQIAKDLGLTKNYYVNWKNRGNIPDGETLNLLAEYFGVSVDYLLTGENKKIPSGLTEEGWELFDLIKQVPPEFYESSKAFLQALVKKQDQE